MTTASDPGRARTHGTDSCYAGGCRQPECVHAHREYARAYMRRRRATGGATLKGGQGGGFKYHGTDVLWRREASAVDLVSLGHLTASQALLVVVFPSAALLELEGNAA